jgi:acyl carrier protein
VAISAGTAVAAAAEPDLLEQLAGAIGSAKLHILAGRVDSIAARILGLGALALERDRSLTELGLDSLMAVELRNALGAAIGRALPASLVFDHPTAAALTGFLAGELGVSAPRAPEPDWTPPVPADDLDDEPALLLLERKLSHAGY